MAELFALFCDLSRGRGDGFSGPGKLTWETIDAWMRRRGVNLIDFEIDRIFELDAIFRTIVAEKQKKPNEGGQT